MAAAHLIRPTHLIPFVLGAFGLTWGLAIVYVAFPSTVESLFGPLSMTNPLFILAVYAPAIAAIGIVLFVAGLPGIRRFLKRALLWRCPLRWYAFILVGIPAIMYAGAAMNGAILCDLFPIHPWMAIFPALAMAAVIGPVEEFGWRGFALPLLQQRFRPLAASLILGIIWGLWHLPAFMLSGAPQSAWSFGPFFVGSIAISIIMTPMFNESRGSIFVPAIAHFQLNNPIFPDAHPHDSFLLGISAVIIVFVFRSSFLRRDGAVTEVIAETGSG